MRLPSLAELEKLYTTTLQPTTLPPTTLQPTTLQLTTLQPTTLPPTTVQLTTLQSMPVQTTALFITNTISTTTLNSANIWEIVPLLCLVCILISYCFTWVVKFLVFKPKLFPKQLFEDLEFDVESCHE